MMNENVKKYIIAAAVLIAVGVAGYLLGGYYVDYRARDADVTAKLETLGRNQQLLTTKLDGLTKDLAASQRRIESIAGRIANAESGVADVAGKLADSQIALTESAGLIAENERILSAIQQRAKGSAK